MMQGIVVLAVISLVLGCVSQERGVSEDLKEGPKADSTTVQAVGSLTSSTTTTVSTTTTIRPTTTVRKTTTTLKPMHYACHDGKCLLVKGKGEDECFYNRDCFHFECKQKECVLVKEKGENTCNNTFDCITRWWDDGIDRSSDVETSEQLRGIVTRPK
ncbi:MAG: hypothetical protein ABIH11_07760 [Candidatus Altiarchaeota archaeon]